MLFLTSPLVAAALVATPAAPSFTPAPALAPALGLQTAGTQDEDPPIPDCGEMQILPSGLKFCVIKEGGDAEFPSMGDLVRVDYTGWNLDGSVFDTSRKPRRPGLPAAPAEFAVGGLIDGWNEALQLMSPGDQWKIFVPSALAYGERGAGADIAPNVDLIFELELHAIIDRVPAFVAWDDEAEGNQTLESGVTVNVLEEGSGPTVSESDLGVLKFACYNPGGGFAIAHTTRNQARLMVSKNPTPLAFLKELHGFLKPGTRLQVNLPAAQGIGKLSGGRIPSLPEGSNEIWILECERTMTAPKPEFRMPAPEELTTTPSGLQYVIVREGDGRHPKATNKVVAHYAGWFPDGKPFDSSWKEDGQGGPIPFGLDQVISGWTEGLQLMKEGGAAIFVIPGNLAYGTRGRSGIPADATLVFYVELVMF